MDTDETLSFSIRNRLRQTVRSLRKGFLRELRQLPRIQLALIRESAFLSVSIRVHPWSKNISSESFRLKRGVNGLAILAHHSTETEMRCDAIQFNPELDIPFQAIRFVARLRP